MSRHSNKKDLFIDWRWGERYFARQLLDYDLSQNLGGWQWSASIGTDAQPYFRVFNPILQSKRFDPEGDYIRKIHSRAEQISHKRNPCTLGTAVFVTGAMRLHDWKGLSRAHRSTR
ncbi:MAG: hypothetical protein IPK83_21950 [Planctomycetes bacterium]|nr:hypothetical protein [Planctomycetota bacterium]